MRVKRAGCLSKEERFPSELPSGDTLGPSESRLEAPVGRRDTLGPSESRLEVPVGRQVNRVSTHVLQLLVSYCRAHAPRYRGPWELSDRVPTSSEDSSRWWAESRIP